MNKEGNSSNSTELPIPPTKPPGVIHTPNNIFNKNMFYDSSQSKVVFKKEDCAFCHIVSGTILASAGLYSLMIKNDHPKSKAWLTFVGTTTLSFGLYWGLIHRHIFKETDDWEDNNNNNNNNKK